MSPKQMPFSKEEYYQMLNNMLMMPSQGTQGAQGAGALPIDRIRQAVMNQVRPAMTAMAGTAQ